MRHSAWRTGASVALFCSVLLNTALGRAENSVLAGSGQPTAADSKSNIDLTERVGGRAGFVYFGRSRSHALPHFLKPAFRLDYSRSLNARWELGFSLKGVGTTNANYGVWSTLGQLGYALVLGNDFRLVALLGLGAGYNAPILHSDLKAGFPIIPYAALGLEPRWRVGQSMELGVSLESEQLTVIQLAMLLSYRL